ncbi:molecular chaperone DnaJ [Brevibacterium sp. BRM-1]|uniref:molecular chaperone DnaJ n=1 Tax=Brevibacterium sp. BRM-1 TaxID=2999062 RepID=UPI0022817EAB|nr:molecular chaperone DnaJ [Brevibacterium sp. BRM-1]WAL40947.1 molecular chaperone DnaJ [Brevibacterium sp. BRM-1]
MSDHYQTLGVSKDASAEEIKRAYRKMARKYHPDVNPGHGDEFKAVAVAYEVLSDPAKRRNYDMGGGQYGQGFGGGAGADFGFSDLFETFFGGGGGAGGRRSAGPASRKRRGKDALIGMTIDLKTSVFGGTEDLDITTAEVCETCGGEGTRPGTHPETCGLCHGQGSVQQMTRTLLGQMVTNQTCTNCGGYGTVIKDPCNSCSGEGRVRARRTLSVKVPAGVKDGTRILLAGKGEVGPGGGPAGDLHLEVTVKEDPVFRRDGDDLRATLTLPMTAAALGTTMTLDTFDGQQSLEIPAGTQSGSVERLPGLGATRLRHGSRGDLLVTIAVSTPAKLDDRQRELLEQLAEARGEQSPEPVLGEPSAKSRFSRFKERFGR